MFEGAPLASLGLSDADSTLAALELQLTTLITLSSQLTAARLLVPPSPEFHSWTGLAASAYGHSLHSLEQQLAVAATRLNDAIAETGRAIDTVGR